MPKATIHRLRPLTIAQLKIAAETGQLTPEDIQTISWIRRARTIRLPHTVAEQLVSNIAIYVRAWREDHHISINEFAQQIGIKACAVSQFECGINKMPTLDTLMRYADAVGAELRLEFIPRPRKRRHAKAS